MIKSVTRPPLRGVFALSTRVLGAVWILATLACEGSGSAPATQRPEGYRADARAPQGAAQRGAGEAAREERRRVQVLGDYGSFKVVQVDDAALASLPAGAELRDDFNDILLNAGVIDTASRAWPVPARDEDAGLRQALPPRAVLRPHPARVGARSSRPRASRS